MEVRGFGSDNHAAVLPEALAAIAAANVDHAAAYGTDTWSDRLRARVREEFGDGASAFPVLTGSGANVISLRAATEPWSSVICTSNAHIHNDECGAPERFGIKLQPVATPDAKLTPELVEPMLIRFGDEHAAQPRVISITQATELGTVYTPDETRALADLVHAHDMVLHLDGARLANAAAALDVPLRAITTDVGVDVVSFGGTKNGLLLGEAVILLGERVPASALPYLRKQSLQLASKQRFVSAQLDALLTDDLWRRTAAHANAMAARLADAVRDLAGVQITQRVETNVVFARIDPAAAAELRVRWRFYDWNTAAHEVRWMCSWDTTADDVDSFATDIARICR